MTRRMAEVALIYRDLVVLARDMNYDIPTLATALEAVRRDCVQFMEDPTKPLNDPREHLLAIDPTLGEGPEMVEEPAPQPCFMAYPTSTAIN